SSTLTTLAAFLPLLFWPGVAGEFMSYLPTTVFAVLLGALLYALLFAPLIGSFVGSRTAHKDVDLSTDDDTLVTEFKGIKRPYVAILRFGIRNPGLVFLGSLAILVGIIVSYVSF